ncbi:hypothetical protein FV219_03875 [Methylobacterium sp. WL122]|nr:hypothetical protein FV219_03875 [Methylobacterium sp. WL122]
MNIQDLCIEKFRNEIRETYGVVYDFFDPFDGEGIWDPEHDDIQKAFGTAAAEMKDHVVRGRFVSEYSRMKVLSDLSKGEDLMAELKPESRKIGAVSSMVSRIEAMGPVTS